MKVKRLEIQGFKSFKDKTVIHFDHNITGIVGPNGCGKSNIVDAFFWVMGEQSYKHMRGNSSEDLIFNGSSKYSALGLAEATLVLETNTIDTSTAPAGATVSDVPLNTTSKEISVTRRLYRSGEGEYLINGTIARLKDIQELFMDTGVGTKGYSVIEQGQIGKIVNSKPDERRLLIEEAAGIAKYKSRKKESIRKMEATQANLARLTDIIQEIDKNLSSLERQAQKAKQYKKYKDELFGKEMTWGRRKSSTFQKKLTLLRQEREILEQDLAGFRAELQTYENDVQVDQIQLVTHSKEAERLQTRIQELSEELSQEKGALELSRRRQGDLHTQFETLQTEKTDLEISLTQDQQNLTDVLQQVEVESTSFQETAEQLQQYNQQIGISRKEVDQARVQLDSSQRELMGQIQQISELNSKSNSLLTKAESAREQSERLLQQKETQNQKLSAIQEELEKSKQTIATIQEQRSLLTAERQQQSSHLQSEEQKLRPLEKEKNDSLRSLTQLKSKLQSLEELDAAHEGLGDGPRAALEWAKKSGHGSEISPITDLIRVTPGYESVLQTWLENRMEDLFVTDPSFAIPLLEKLREGKQGRVTLQLFLDSLKTSHSAKPFSEIRTFLESHGFKVLGELSQFIQSEASRVESLIHSVCIVESSSPMTNFLAKNQTPDLLGWSVVSMDGVALQQNGTLRGGSLENTEAMGVLRRKQLIQELHGQVDESETSHQKLEDSVIELKQEIEIGRARLQTLQSEIQSFEVQVAALDRDIHQTERAFKEARSHLENLEEDAEQMASQEERALYERETLETQLQELIAGRSQLEEKISNSEGSLLEKENQFKTHDAQLQAIRIQEASLRERRNSLNKERESLASMIESRKRRLTEISRVLERTAEEQAQFTGGESDLRQRVEELTLTLGTFRENLSLSKDQIEQFNAKVNIALEQTKILHKKIEQKNSESNQLALEIEKLSGEISHLVLNLEEKYGVGCLNQSDQTSDGPSDQQEEPSDHNESVLAEEVEKLRERIRRLGEVNVMAIEEFEILKKRSDYLLTEKADLERSLDNLKEAIEHINRTSEERFKKAFEAIADRFERLFPIIFGGGQAKLSLIYPEGSSDILDAGVDILAQPPGKKVANITLLSGGEKALTAVSLIFAIFMVKPSPFCVLDEVDAPLDDANIGKFNALLREMSAKSQFILITHNKRTMELNDTLYGVTMEEPGVSKMVSIEIH